MFRHYNLIKEPERKKLLKCSIQLLKVRRRKRRVRISVLFIRVFILVVTVIC